MSRRPRAIHTTSPLHSVSTTLALVLVSVCLAIAGAQAEESEKKKEISVIEAGSMVGIEYTLTLQDGTQVDSNVGGEALRFEQGSGRIVAGLDRELTGMSAGETKRVTVTPEEGYGPVDPSAFTEVPLSDLPDDARKAGTALMAQDAQGRTHRLRVHKIEGDRATLDFNHPLAGKTLIFDVKILEVQ